MKQNKQNWALFVARETIQCLLQNSSEKSSEKDKVKEDADITNYLLQEVVNQSILETVEGTTSAQMIAIEQAHMKETKEDEKPEKKLQTLNDFDQGLVYIALDVMHALGFTQWKSDIQYTQKFVKWLGLSNFISKYKTVFQAQDQKELISLDKFKEGTDIEQFIMQVIFRITHSEDKEISKIEIKALKNEYLYKDADAETKRVKKQMYLLVETFLCYTGLVERKVTVLQGKIQMDKDRVAGIKSLKWTMQNDKQIAELFKTQQLDFDDKSFFKNRYQGFPVQFVKEPTQAATQCFQNSGFAMFKGRSWRYFMQKLYCVIGRSPVNYKKKGRQLGIKVVWHVDVDLGHLRKVSRQHALIIFNFEEQCFEIKCLSRKYPVYVNRKPLKFEDPPKVLESGSIVAISSESFFFMLPPQLEHSIGQLQMSSFCQKTSGVGSGVLF